MHNESINEGTIPPARIVRDLMIAAPEGVNSEGTVEAALADMSSEGVVSSPVTDQNEQFMGTVSESELNRKVGGKGHDPAKEPLVQQMNPHSVYCFEDDLVEAAEQTMEKGNLDQLPVLNRNFTLLGKITLQVIKAAAK